MALLVHTLAANMFDLQLEGQTYTLKRDRRGVDDPTQLGSGGAKVIHQLSSDTAVALPNADADNPELILERWERMSHEEQAMSSYLASLNLLTIPTEIKIASIGGMSLPVLIMPTFKSLEAKNIYIAEGQNNSPFGSIENMQSPEYVCEVMRGMIPDIATLLANGISLSRDALHIAIIDNSKSPPQIRPFYFDFSDKHKAIGSPSHVRPNNIVPCIRANDVLESHWHCINDAASDECIHLSEKTYLKEMMKVKDTYKQIKVKLVEELVAEVQKKHPVALPGSVIFPGDVALSPICGISPQVRGIP